MAETQLTADQLHLLEVTQRVGGAFSLVGSTFVLLTFSFSMRFRKPVNRLIFYALWGNLFATTAAFVGQSGIRLGPTSALCQFQGFMIQFCLPADILWNLMMAINVYLTVFKNYTASDLKGLERRYIILCYGIPFVLALSLCFASSLSKGRVYGSADIWCWISSEWKFLRICLTYGPIWVGIVFASIIYIKAGREIFRKREQLRVFQGYLPSSEEATIKTPSESHQSNEVHVSREVTVTGEQIEAQSWVPRGMRSQSIEPDTAYPQYSVSIEPNFAGTSRDPSHKPSGLAVPRVHHHQHTAALAANAAAWGYTKCAILFFTSFIITWTPSSIDRGWALTNSGVNWPLTYAAGLVLPLMGLWNSLIYIIASWEAVESLFHSSSKPHPRTGAGSANDTSIKLTLASSSVDGRHQLPSVPSDGGSEEFLTGNSSQGHSGERTRAAGRELGGG